MTRTCSLHRRDVKSKQNLSDLKLSQQLKLIKIFSGCQLCELVKNNIVSGTISVPIIMI
jgi:hypothetical protein